MRFEETIPYLRIGRRIRRVTWPVSQFWYLHKGELCWSNDFRVDILSMETFDAADWEIAPVDIGQALLLLKEERARYDSKPYGEYVVKGIDIALKILES